MTVKNPIIRLDMPDPDVIRVEDTYYMVSTTMHFMPGCEILRSYDLLNWEHAAYVYSKLDSTDGQRLKDEKTIYGQGMWAASLRFHAGVFYVCFVCNDTHKTYLYTTRDLYGTWEKHNIEGFYHDCSLLFDDDGRIYIVYGNKYIWLTELNQELTGPKEGGLHRMIISDEGNPGLGYEGAHFYKINGQYYVFLIHSRRDRWMRVEACFAADSPEGEFTGGDVLEDTIGYCGQGVAQGGIVDTPDGDWYAVLFQDRGAVGRIPVLLPISWKNGYPVFGVLGRIPEEFDTPAPRRDYHYNPLVQSDDFKGTPEEQADKTEYGSFGFKSSWQLNHEPELSLIKHDRNNGTVTITAGKLCKNLTQAQNTLTQRMLFPGCSGEITVDASALKEGDYAGICALQGCYGMVAVTKRGGSFQIVMMEREADNSSLAVMNQALSEGIEREAVPAAGPVVRLRAKADFTNQKDEAEFFYLSEGGWRKIGVTHKLYFKLDHFVGCRFGLFLYATKEVGGTAEFSKFIYQ